MEDEEPREWFILRFSGDDSVESWIVADGPFTYQEAMRLWADDWGHTEAPYLVRKASIPYAKIQQDDHIEVVAQGGYRSLRKVLHVERHIILLTETPGDSPNFVHMHEGGEPCDDDCGPLTPMLSPVTPVLCPTCGTGDWDDVLNDQAVCRRGHRWTQPAEDKAGGRR